MNVLCVILITSIYTICLADQIVYLDRIGLPLKDAGGVLMAEPIFNPKYISANVGEQVHFVTRFTDISSILVRHSLRYNELTLP